MKQQKLSDNALDHEVEFVRHFVVPARRERYLSLLDSRKGRTKFLFALNHFKDLDMRRASLVSPSAQNPDHIETLLRQRGAADRCNVTSSNPETDGSQMFLRDALEQTVGQGCGTIISCIAGRLAYFEGEEKNERYILERQL